MDAQLQTRPANKPRTQTTRRALHEAELLKHASALDCCRRRPETVLHSNFSYTIHMGLPELADLACLYRSL